jgi:hypothetical protein
VGQPPGDSRHVPDVFDEWKLVNVRSVPVFPSCISRQKRLWRGGKIIVPFWEWETFVDEPIRDCESVRPVKHNLSEAAFRHGQGCALI